MGLTAEDVPEEDVELWPDTQASIYLFLDMRTQWRPECSGLDYSALPTVMRLRRIPRTEQAAVFDDLRVMEVAAMNEIHKDRR